MQSFRWTSATGMTSLPVLNGSVEAYAVNNDGSVIVGRSGPTPSYHAAVWSQRLVAGASVVDLQTYVPSLGIDLTGWTLSGATGISADGRTIAGYGQHNGNSEAWVLTLPRCGSADFNHDGAPANNADIQAFFACLAGHCCPSCDTADFNGDGAVAT